MAEEFDPGTDAKSDGLVARLEATLGLGAALVLFAVMSVTVIDVVGRYAFDAPLPAGYELIQIGMAFMVFLIVPVLAARDEQVRIEVLERIFPARLRPALRLVGTMISLVVVCGFAWLLWRRGVSFVESGETTSNLRVPLAPLAFFIAGAWAVTAAIAAWRLVQWRRRAAAGRR